METYISMLRGINVGGQKRILMQDLKQLYESLDLANVQTYVQSGNVVFDSRNQPADSLTGMIEATIQLTYGFSVSVFLRRAPDFQRILSANPFLTQRHVESSALYVAFLYRQPDLPLLESLAVPAGESAEFIIGQQEIFLYYPDGSGRSKFSHTYIERKLKVSVTTRNWNTLCALFDLANAR